jgi:hypothetical protein
MMETWIKTKILLYVGNNFDMTEEQRKLLSLGIAPKKTEEKPELHWTDYAFLLEDTIDFYTDPDSDSKGGTKIRLHDGRTFTVRAKFMQVFLSVIGRVDEVEEDEDWQVYCLDMPVIENMES